MSEPQDQSGLFDRLARTLGAVRQDASPAQIEGTDQLSQRVSQLESELRSLAANAESSRQQLAQQGATIARMEAAATESEASLAELRHAAEAWRQHSEHQDSIIARLEAEATRREADVAELRQAAELFSRQVQQPGAGPVKPPGGNPPRRAAAILGAALAVLVLAGGLGWLASRHGTAIDALVDRFAPRFSNPVRADVQGAQEPAPSVRAVVQVAPSAEPDSPAAPAPIAAIPAIAGALPPTPAGSPAADASVSVSPQPEQQAAASPSLPDALAAPAGPDSSEAPNAAASPPGGDSLAAAAPQALGDTAMPTPPATNVSSATPPTDLRAIQTQAVTTPAVSAPPPSAAHQIVLRATANAWVRVRQRDGRVLLVRIMKPGETWTAPAGVSLILDIGNTDGLKADVDGVHIRWTGATGGVIHDLSLDPDLLGSGRISPAYPVAAAPDISPPVAH